MINVGLSVFSSAMNSIYASLTVSSGKQKIIKLAKKYLDTSNTFLKLLTAFLFFRHQETCLNDC